MGPSNFDRRGAHYSDDVAMALFGRLQIGRAKLYSYKQTHAANSHTVIHVFGVLKGKSGALLFCGHNGISFFFICCNFIFQILDDK